MHDTTKTILREAIQATPEERAQIAQDLWYVLDLIDDQQSREKGGERKPNPRERYPWLHFKTAKAVAALVGCTSEGEFFGPKQIKERTGCSRASSWYRCRAAVRVGEAKKVGHGTYLRTTAEERAEFQEGLLAKNEGLSQQELAFHDHPGDRGKA